MRKELGLWFMDVAKYIATVFLLTGIFDNVSTWKWYTYVFIVIFMVVTMGVGLKLIKEEEKK